MRRVFLVASVALILSTGCVDDPALGTDRAEAAAYKPLGFARVTSAGAITSRFQSAGGTTTASRLGTGRYLITFPGLGQTLPVDGWVGNAQVVAEGANDLRCRFTGAVITSSQSQIYVDCFTPSAAPADAAFAVLYYRTLMPAPNALPTHAAYTLVEAAGTISSSGRDYNSSGVHNTVTKFGAGMYRVNIPNGGPVNASVMITPADPDQPGNVCSVLSWSAGQVWVECRDPSSALEDTRFSLSYAVTGPTVDQQGAHAWFNGANAHPSYSAALGKMIGCSAASIAATPSGSLTTVTLTGDLGTWDGSAFLQVPFASRYGSAGYCKVESSTTSGVAPSWSAVTTVRCYAPDGTVVAAPKFAFTTITNDVAGPC